MKEADFIQRLRAIADHPAARGLIDDAAVFDIAGTALVLTHDMLVEGVHFLPDDTPEGIAWKLVAVNMSDLAAKGAEPLGVLMGAGLARDADWDERFADGLAQVLDHFGTALLGGDTVAMPAAGPITLGMTAIGLAPMGGAPGRSGAQVGDTLWVTGTIGDAGLGLAIRQGQCAASDPSLIRAYTHPQPHLALGQALAPLVTAMADVSDGLLLDAQRLAAASGVGIALDLAAVPLSGGWLSLRGDAVADRTAAATMGDDYQLLFTAPSGLTDQIVDAATQCNVRLTQIGTCGVGMGLQLLDQEQPVKLPLQLGYLHGQ